MNPFWRHVVRCANQRVRGGGLGAEEAAESQISQFDYAFASDENIGRLYVYKDVIEGCY